MESRIGKLDATVRPTGDCPLIRLRGIILPRDAQVTSRTPQSRALLALGRRLATVGSLTAALRGCMFSTPGT